MNHRTCPCGYEWPEGSDPWSPILHREHKEAHLKRFPKLDNKSREALDDLIAQADRQQKLSEVRRGH